MQRISVVIRYWTVIVAVGIISGCGINYGVDSEPRTYSETDQISEECVKLDDVSWRMCFVPGGRVRVSGVRGFEAVVWVDVQPFWIADRIVSNEEYEQYDSAHRHRRGDQSVGEMGPVAKVSHEEALAYASWLSDRTGMRFRLPSVSEWTYACLGGSAGRYPWEPERHQDSTDIVNARLLGRLESGMTGKGEKNRYGLYDLIGNMQEWTSDIVSDKLGVSDYTADRPLPVAAVTKGCDSSVRSIELCSCTSWLIGVTDERYGHIGFRLAADANVIECTE